MKKSKKKLTCDQQDLIYLNKIIKKKCNDSFLELKNRHEKLFYSVCNRFTNRVPLEDIYKDIDFVFFKAILSFKPDKKAKFSTWLGNFTRYHCLNYIKNNNKYVITDDSSLDHFFNEKSVEEHEHKTEYANDLDHVFHILEKLSDKRIFKIFKLRYTKSGPRLTWKQIAEEFDLTPQTIINLHTKGRRILRKKMKDHKILSNKKVDRTLVK
jgi:RNA polymerase sigma factor (sigma-70 family)